MILTGEKGMKKIIAAALAALMLILLLTGCGKKEIDATKLSAELLENGSFAETLTEVSENVTKKRLNLDDSEVEMCASFKGTNAVVDEIIIIKTSDTDSVQEKIQNYVQSQIEQYASYRASEVPKLENAVIYVAKNTVVYCASVNSDKAMKIITEHESN